MAIIRTDPEDWQKANSVLVDSDARDDVKALLEIQDWAYDHGFACVPTTWLQPVLLADGRRAFRGFCYRLTPEVKAANQKLIEDIAETAARLPVTPHVMDK